MNLDMDRNELLRVRFYIEPEIHDSNWLNSETDEDYGDNRLVKQALEKLITEIDKELGI